MDIPKFDPEQHPLLQAMEQERLDREAGVPDDPTTRLIYDCFQRAELASIRKRLAAGLPVLLYQTFKGGIAGYTYYPDGRTVLRTLSEYHGRYRIHYEFRDGRKYKLAVESRNGGLIAYDELPWEDRLVED